MSARWGTGAELLRLLMVLSLVAALGTLAACAPRSGDAADSSSESDDSGEGENGDGENGDDDEEEAVPVELTSLERGRIESVLRLSTNLEAEEAVQVFSQAARRVRRLYVEEGDQVRRGQLLLQLQDDEQRNALAKVSGQLERERREHDRQQRLFEQELISEQVFNDSAYELEQLELALTDAQRELSYTEVRAPISGTITERLVNVGDHVMVNQRLFDMVDFESIVARIYVPEKELSRLAKGQPARIFADAFGSEERHGEVERIAPIVDPRSGTVKVTVKVPPEEGLRPGMYVSVELVTSVHEDALLVPKRALVYDSEQVFVFRLKDDSRVQRLKIEPVLEDRERVEASGQVLAEGDRIVVAGQAGLKEGTLVRDAALPKPEESEAGETDEVASGA